MRDPLPTFARLAVACACVLLSAAALGADSDQVDLLPGGIVCDRSEQVCYDQRGANVAETGRKFGEYAAQEVRKRLDKKNEWGTKKFTLSNGVKCNIGNRVCKKDEGEGERSKKITNHLFQAAPQPR
jgi:hypothetical protein